MRWRPLFMLAAILLGACRQSANDAVPRAAPSVRAGDPLAAHDPPAGAPRSLEGAAGEQPLMRLQVVLDRLGFTPGVIDGKPGLSTRNALAGFQEANGLAKSGDADPATLQALRPWEAIVATRLVTIPADFAADPFYAVPHDPARQAQMPTLGYASLDEKLAERFHTTIDTLRTLNPGIAAPPASPATSASASPVASDAPFVPGPGPASWFRAGQTILVPNVGNDVIVPGSVKDAEWQRTLASLGVGSSQPRADRVIVSKSAGTLRVYDAAGKLVAMFTATMGSSHDPLPLGDWTINGVAHDPAFHYNPKLFWDASPSAAKAKLPAGPNGPVGVVWIDIDKAHYGIHGTPAPETIGRAESHGCVRLTNWDAARLAQMVAPGTKAVFAK